MLSKIFKDVVLKKPVQSSMIFVRLGQGRFKSDYITRYLHTWVVLRLCIIFTVGESPRICSKYSHWCYHLLIWGGAKVNSIGPLLEDGQRKLCGFILVRSRSNYFAHDGQRALIYPSVPIMRIVYILWYVYQHVNRGIAKPMQLHLRPLKTRISPRIRQGRHNALCCTMYFTLCICHMHVKNSH